VVFVRAGGGMETPPWRGHREPGMDVPPSTQARQTFQEAGERGRTESGSITTSRTESLLSRPTRTRGGTDGHRLTLPKAVIVQNKREKLSVSLSLPYIQTLWKL
jgi:hypothetical protein